MGMNMKEGADVYGQSHPVETPALLRDSLEAFNALMEKIPEDKKVNAILAESKCPELVTDDFKLVFLRCEVFHVDLAVKRYTKYWDKRVDVFGPEKAFEPLTLSGALRDDTAALQTGFFRLMDTKAVGGRSMFFLDPKMQDFQYTQDSMVRAVWYWFHASLEDEDTQKRGVIFIIYSYDSTMGHLDRGLIGRLAKSVQGSLPVRLSAIHFCRPPLVLSTVFPVVKALLGNRLRKRIKVHSGSKHWEDMAKYELTEKNVPEDVGGQVVLDHLAWLEDRRCKGL
ncbi:Transfer protein [Seminavis robusta]|uniref:Transfer protein n=1 Tax=Seminavis robusta TaxID=568900 RepID=A0A9N8H5W2_9STRA|nr:Transfer protein [Seminavis robusta]|eukprot:Sro84_g044780.1 Transfer protein (282) ;mRNA; f:51067-52043